MQLIIMRHGEAESGFGKSISDAERQLTDRGRRQVALAGECLLASGEIPDRLWVSPYRRARQTAAGVVKAFEHLQPATKSCLVPEANPSTVIDAIGTATVATLMLVSHQPLVSSLVAMLSGRDSRTVPVMAPASMVLLRAEELLAGCCDIVWHRHSPDFELMYD